MNCLWIILLLACSGRGGCQGGCGNSCGGNSCGVTPVARTCGCDSTPVTGTYSGIARFPGVSRPGSETCGCEED